MSVSTQCQLQGLSPPLSLRRHWFVYLDLFAVQPCLGFLQRCIIEVVLSTPSHIVVLSERGNFDASVADDRPGYPIPAAVLHDVVHVSAYRGSKYATSSDVGGRYKSDAIISPKLSSTRPAPVWGVSYLCAYRMQGLKARRY